MLVRTVIYVPTSSSWLNLVERWFGELTSKRIRRGSFASVTDLQQAIAEFLAAWNENPKPFVWTATVESIVTKLSRTNTGEHSARVHPAASQKSKAIDPKSRPVGCLNPATTPIEAIRPPCHMVTR